MPETASLSGLYYPHTIVGDIGVLKSALLLWDELTFIVPDPMFKLRSDLNDPLIDEAYDLIGRPHYPSDDEKKQVHEQVEEILATPEGLLALARRDDTLHGSYEIYPQKLLDETWHLLSLSGLVEKGHGLEFLESYGQFQDYVTTTKLGLLLMLYLAQACGGSTRRLITDRVSAYNTLNEALAVRAEPQPPPAPEEHERIVTRSINIVDTDRISLARLIELRKAEQKTGGHHIRELRHNYLTMIDRFVTERAGASPTDLAEIKRRQDQEMQDNMAKLKDALKQAATDVLHEKEVYIAMFAAAGMAVPALTIPAGIVSIVALNKTRLKYKEARRKAMTDHAMSWLFHAAQGRGLSVL